MAETPAKPANPFSGLDKALLRSTQQRSHAEPQGTEPSHPKTTIKPVPTRSRARIPTSVNASEPASTLAFTASTNKDFVQAIRQRVKVPGKEVVYVRLTVEEKQELADIVYTYKRQRRKTSDTEISRIAVNFILEDYRANGANSILASVMEALSA
jgi:hypothetical protein